MSEGCRWRSASMSPIKGWASASVTDSAGVQALGQGAQVTGTSFPQGSPLLETVAAGGARFLSEWKGALRGPARMVSGQWQAKCSTEPGHPVHSLEDGDSFQGLRPSRVLPLLSGSFFVRPGPGKAAVGPGQPPIRAVHFTPSRRFLSRVQPARDTAGPWSANAAWRSFAAVRRTTLPTGLSGSRFPRSGSGRPTCKTACRSSWRRSSGCATRFQ